MNETMRRSADCLLCRPSDADLFFGRTRVWTDGRWLNLAPHRDGDALAGGPAMLRPGAVDVPADEHHAAITAISGRLT